MIKYITAGQLAKLAGTTKRTIIWYDINGVIKPAKVTSNGYRFYKENQVLEFQRVLLLTSLGINLKEIKEYTTSQGSIEKMFEERHKEILEQLDQQRFRLDSLNRYSANLKSNQTMVDPTIKYLEPFGVYYIERVSSYIDIGKHCTDLREMFETVGEDFVTMAIYDNPNYKPKDCPVNVGALASSYMKIKDEFKDEVKYRMFNPGKVITYTHNGPGELLSLFWKELEKYCRFNKIEVRKDFPDFEIYRMVNNNAANQFFEIYLPIK